MLDFTEPPTEDKSDLLVVIEDEKKDQNLLKLPIDLPKGKRNMD